MFRGHFIVFNTVRRITTRKITSISGNNRVHSQQKILATPVLDGWLFGWFKSN